MIAVDTNLLVYAHRADSPMHAPAFARIGELAEGARWAIPWPCLHEFFGIVTHPRVYRPPSTAEQALAQIDAWIASPSLSLLTESDTGWSTLREVIVTSRVVGPAIHDARVAALCIQHGVTELWTCDRDFSRFPTLRVVNPLVPPIPGRARERRSTWGTRRPETARRAERAGRR